jgi:hypothetical protein
MCQSKKYIQYASLPYGRDIPITKTSLKCLVCPPPQRHTVKTQASMGINLQAVIDSLLSKGMVAVTLWPL